MARSASIERNTLETQISVSIDLDGSGVSRLDTGVPFLEHMLDQIARHGMIDLEIAALGDIRKYMVAFAAAAYQNPRSICPQHQMLLPRSIKG